MTIRKLIKLLNHSVDFFLLVVILTAALYFLYYFRYFPQAQIITSFSLGFAYIFWGIFHHVREGDLKMKIIWEYVSSAALVVFVLIIFLLRA